MIVGRFLALIFVALVALCSPSFAAPPPVPTDPAGRTAFIKADREALLRRIHPKWRDFKPQWRPEVCTFRRTANYDPAKVTCGYVLVPENRRDPDSRLIRIAVAQVASLAKAQPPAGSTVYLSGGPGDPSQEMAALLKPDQNKRHRAWLEMGDFFTVDQRGVGYSDAPICRGITGSNDIPVSPSSQRAYAKRIAACLAEAVTRGIDVDAYTTWDNALDFRDIRRALGLDSWNIFGISYGTELGQMILRVDGDGVRAAVLDSVVVPRMEDPRWGRSGPGFVAALDKLNEACAADRACKARYGDLEALARRAVEAYDADPFTINGLDREAYPGGKYVVNGSTVALALFLALYDEKVYPALPALMEALASREADQVLGAYVEALSLPSNHDYGFGMQMVANCSGQPGQPSVGAMSGREAYWDRALLGPEEEQLCARAGRPLADALDAFTPLVTDRPVLVMAGGIDPITPPWQAEQFRTTMPQARYLFAPWIGHGVSYEDCAGGSVMTAFLAAPSKAPSMACVEAMVPPQFVTDYKQTAGAYALLRSFEDGAATGALAWAGASLAVLLFVLLGFAAGPIARRVDGRPVVPAGGARRAAVAAGVLALGGAGLVGWALYTTLSEHPLLVPLGLAGPAQIGGWLIVIGAALGLVAAVLVVRATLRQRPPLGTIIGVLACGSGAVALAAFASVNGLL